VTIRWMCVVLGALLLEAVLCVTLVPVSFVNTMPFPTAAIGVLVVLVDLQDVQRVRI